MTVFQEGSTDSIYEPAYSQTLKEVLPRYQCSPALLSRKPEWSGSDLSINSARTQCSISSKRNNRRSCVPTSPLNNETSEKCKAPSQSSTLTRNGSLKEQRCDRMQTHQPAQVGEKAADMAESLHTTGRIKKLQSLVQTKKGQQCTARRGKSASDNPDHSTDVFSNNNPVLTCIGLGRRTENTLSKTDSSLQLQQHKVRNIHEDSKDEGVWWSPFECPQPWSPFYHTCQQPQHEPRVCGGGTLSLPWATEWDRFESLIQELDRKQPDLSPPQMIPSIADLQFSQNTLTRFDALGQPPPSSKPQDNGSPSQENDETKNVWVERRESDKNPKASPEETQTAVDDGITQRDEAEKQRVGGGSLKKAHRRSGDSLESLYSLNSGQSSSSGVASGSGWSSNRDSLRLDDDLLSTKQFYGRARVHTDFVPSPYDTESLRLKVGDVIHIHAKPPMGIWTGMLNGKMGNFKFIYVDVLREESPDSCEETQTKSITQKSTIQEVLRRLSLEEYTSSLELHGYQTVDDLMRLREHHLTELNVTDPEHRHRLLTALNSLQQVHSDWQPENEANQEVETPGENTKAEVSNCPRDSGCHMVSDSPDTSTEDADLHFYLQSPTPPEMEAS
ncbi:SAM domain-containing protein SAMSN-1b [Notolabrus celidotus]|uniref:SAM domain-containing protein SAMSN-1b n=1 Tax=Notolabrus celidotus TaxID=1203425 RepID=UPI00148FD550|nr:SAM domain-containing protein SAMSN-1b [Notolabrus celidotus]